MIRQVRQPTYEVLVVSDDNPTARELIGLLNLDRRFGVLLADNAFDAGTLTRTHKPRVILMSDAVTDLNLRDAVGRIRADKTYAKVCLICLTDYDTPLPAGADECLPIGSDANEILSVICRHLALEPPDPRTQ